MPPKNGQESSEFAAILAEMRAIKKGLSVKLDELSKKVDGVAADVKDVRHVCRQLFDAVLEQEIELDKTKKRVDDIELELKLLKRGGNGSSAAPPDSSRAVG